jgi:hypothetical protein
MPLLTQNSEMRKTGAWNWTLPAWVVTLPTGTSFNVCPNAGACAKFCYARNGTYLFSNVKSAHMRNLMMVLDDPDGWQEAMTQELWHKRYRPKGIIREIPDVIPETLSPDIHDWMMSGGAAIRVHDSGDYFSADYLRRWLHIADAVPDVLFYSYTKEVSMFREIAVPEAPANFLWVYSMGGRQDHLVDKDTERHADVFPDINSLLAAGYMSQEESDLQSVLLPTTRIGIPANNIAHFNKKLNGRTFGETEAQLHRSTRG